MTLFSLFKPRPPQLSAHPDETKLTWYELRYDSAILAQQMLKFLSEAATIYIRQRENKLFVGLAKKRQMQEMGLYQATMQYKAVETARQIVSLKQGDYHPVRHLPEKSCDGLVYRGQLYIAQAEPPETHALLWSLPRRSLA